MWSLSDDYISDVLTQAYTPAAMNVSLQHESQSGISFTRAHVVFLLAL